MTERTNESYAIEFGRYLASAAEAYMDAVDDYSIDPDNAYNIDNLGDTYRGLTSAIYEFRKRADRCKI